MTGKRVTDITTKTFTSNTWSVKLKHTQENEKNPSNKDGKRAISLLYKNSVISQKSKRKISKRI